MQKSIYNKYICKIDFLCRIMTFSRLYRYWGDGIFFAGISVITFKVG